MHDCHALSAQESSRRSSSAGRLIQPGVTGQGPGPGPGMRDSLLEDPLNRGSGKDSSWNGLRSKLEEGRRGRGGEEKEARTLDWLRDLGAIPPLSRTAAGATK